MSIVDRERQLWEASAQYMRGEISSERLEQLELAYSLSRQDAIFAVATRNMRWIILTTFLMLLFLITLLTITMFFITRNPFSFFLLVGLIPSLIEALYYLIRYLIPVDDEFYQIKALKLQEKQRNKRRSSRI